MDPRGRSLRFLPLAAALLLVVGLQSSMAYLRGSSDALPARSVVLISIDTLRPDRLGAYGYDRPTSPTLDALAADGARFAACVAPAPWTPPSHISMLTGLYPSRTGIRAVSDDLRPEVHTLAEEMRARGFHTAAVVGSDLVLPCARCRAGFDSLTEVPWRGNPDGQGPVVADRGDDVTAAAVHWLDARDARDRFFLFVHYYDVHSDYRPRPAMALRFGADPNDMEPGNTTYLIDRRESSDIPVRDQEQMKRLYDAEVRQLDELLRTLFDSLKARNLWSDTLIVVAADHGEEFLEHGGLLHGRTLYEELVHVPLIMRGPGVPHGRVISHVVSLVDLMPTILDAVGAPPRDGLTGRSLLPMLTGADRDWVERAASEADQTRRKRMVRVGNLKLIEDRGTGYELYDLAQDPRERHNLAAERPEQVGVLAGEMRAVLTDGTPSATGTLDNATRERLRALGYLDE